VRPVQIRGRIVGAVVLDFGERGQKHPARRVLALPLRGSKKAPTTQPGVSAAAINGLLALGLLSAALLTVGVRPRSCAGLCFTIAVSVQRWNFLVYYADDMAVQLLLFWLMYLPTGHTLHLARPARLRRAEWREARVPVFQVKLFMANVLLVYVVAGLTKLTSPMWCSGTALYAILKLPFARIPDAWGSEML